MRKPDKAQIIYDYAVTNGIKLIWFGDMETIETLFDLVGMTLKLSDTPSPIRRARNVLRVLDNSPLFSKCWVRACGWRSRRETMHPAYEPIITRRPARHGGNANDN